MYTNKYTYMNTYAYLCTNKGTYIDTWAHAHTQQTYKHACTHNRYMHAQILICRTKSYKVPEALSFYGKDPPQSHFVINASSFIHSVNIC